MKEKISVIVPTYNEKGNIACLIDDIDARLGGYDHEILIVDDNSPDGTYELVLGLKNSHVRAIRRTQDRGLAKSIRCGLENAAGAIIIVMDSDFNHQPKYIPFMLQSMDYYDCVCASRFLYGGGMENKTRQILSWMFNIFIRIMTGGCVTDSLYGFFAIRRWALELCKYDDIFWGYGDYCVRLLYYLQKNNVNILQFPAVNGKRFMGKGNDRFFKVFRQYFTEVLKLTYKVRIKDRLCTKK